MISSHASHQVGLDVDLWLTPMPSRRLRVAERETFVPVSMLADGTCVADPARLTPAHVALIRRAAWDPDVARIFVHPGIKQALCRVAGGDRSWLAKVRPWWGHDSHFHVRLACPPGEPRAAARRLRRPATAAARTSPGGSATSRRPKPPGPAPKPVTLADLPAECAAVLRAP